VNNRDLRDQLLSKQMSRKQFLQYMAGAVIVALGVKNFLNLFTQYNNKALGNGQATESKKGFGSSKFGV
jgi:hypothetical protein